MHRIQNTFLRRSALVLLILPVAVIEILDAAVKGAYASCVELVEAFRHVWRGGIS